MEVAEMKLLKVPKLRFREFEGEWSVSSMKSIASKITDGTHDTPPQVASGIPYLTAIHVKDGQIAFQDCYYLSPEDHARIYQRCNPEKGDLLIVNIGAGTATCASVSVDYEFSLKNVALIKPNRSLVDSGFLSQYQRKQTERLFVQLTSGGAQPFLSLKELGKLKVSAPTLPEQQKIASFLSAVDERLGHLARKKQLLQQYKKGVMQQLFAQELRFKREDGSDYEDWEEKRLGEIATITTGSSNRVDSSLDGLYTFFDRSEDIRTSSIYLFDGEAVIVAGEGQAFVPKYFVGKFDLHQRTYAVMNFNQCAGKFIFYSIGFYSNYFLSKAVGSTVKSLRLPMFVEMPVNLPCLAEQQKIADFLSSLDEKIDAVSAQMALTQQFKKGLLQELFV
jgi:type I restriction enzyme S subunit